MLRLSRTRLRQLFTGGFAAVAGAMVLATAICFPWSTDPGGGQSVARPHADYYRRAYSAGADSRMPGAGTPAPALSEREEFYVKFARETALQHRVPERVRGFVEKYGLKEKRVLEVGAGSGLLQDLVQDYTALDISPSARRFFHKPFVEASATDMPFSDNFFDGAWSIWVLEHIPNPEKALLEMRRVVKPGGYLFLQPAFAVSRYAAQGYRRRPFSDFDWRGKLMKLSIPLADSRWFHYLQSHQVRLLRSLGARLGSGPARLHFIKLTPNYEQYWEADSDATTSVSYHELYLWFKTRGDACLNCPSEAPLVLRDVRHDPYMIIQVRKP